MGAAQVCLDAMGAILEDRQDWDRAICSARESLGEAAFEEALEEGRAMSMEEAVEYALQEPGKPTPESP